MIQLVCSMRQTLKNFTDDHLASASFCFDYLIKNKEIKVNGQKISGDILLNAGDTVSYYMTKRQEERLGFSVVYEDDNVWVVDKESGVNSHAVFAQLSRQSGDKCAFIHRLDRNTCGLLIFAKNKEAEEELLVAFQEKHVEKRYLALCFGKFPKQEDVLIGYLKKDEEHARVRIYLQKTALCERIITEYKVLEEREDDTTLVEIVLHTGKTHQIRAHMAFIGCPVVGDMKYGQTHLNKMKKKTRQQLVSKYLSVHTKGVLAYLNDKQFTSQFNL